MPTSSSLLILWNHDYGSLKVSILNAHLQIRNKNIKSVYTSYIIIHGDTDFFLENKLFSFIIWILWKSSWRLNRVFAQWGKHIYQTNLILIMPIIHIVMAFLNLGARTHVLDIAMHDIERLNEHALPTLQILNRMLALLVEFSNYKLKLENKFIH